jgi:AAA domain
MSRGGRASRQKGNRTDRAVVRLLQDHGLAAERVPLSGAARGRFGGDVSVPALGRDLRGDVKCRGDGFNRLYDWLESHDFLVLRADRKSLLVVARIELAAEIVMAAERREPVMKIIGADERLAEKSGAKILIVGPPGVGKTSLLRTTSPQMLASTLFVDIEAGDIAVSDLPVASVRPRRWEECRDLACALGGFNPALPATAAYSEAHFNEVMRNPAFAQLASYETLFVDSLTAAARLSFAWAEQQPEAFTDRGRKDLRAIYGVHARTMLGWLNQLQHARGRNVCFVAVLEKNVDDFNVATWQPQIEGGKTRRELPAIVDEIITMQWIDFGDRKPVRAFVCTNPNPWGYPAKDRSGRLEQLEPPNLGALIKKLTGSTQRKPFVVPPEQSAQDKPEQPAQT